MKISDKVRWAICFGAASILIIVPIVLRVLAIPYNPKILDVLEMVVIIVVGYFLIVYPGLNKGREQEGVETKETRATEEDQSEQKLED